MKALPKKVTLDDYLARVLLESKTQEARDVFRHQLDRLKPVSQKSGVEAQYIIALWA